MSSDGYDDPKIQAHWIMEEHKKLIDYLHREGVDHGGIPAEPDWLIGPYLATWRIMSLRLQERWVGGLSLVMFRPTTFLLAGFRMQGQR